MLRTSTVGKPIRRYTVVFDGLTVPVFVATALALRCPRPSQSLSGAPIRRHRGFTNFVSLFNTATINDLSPVPSGIESVLVDVIEADTFVLFRNDIENGFERLFVKMARFTHGQRVVPLVGRLEEYIVPLRVPIICL